MRGTFQKRKTQVHYDLLSFQLADDAYGNNLKFQNSIFVSEWHYKYACL